jgi:hypothetical protein
MFCAFGDQGALFKKTTPWTPAKTFDKKEQTHFLVSLQEIV